MNLKPRVIVFSRGYKQPFGHVVRPNQSKQWAKVFWLTLEDRWWDSSDSCWDEVYIEFYCQLSSYLLRKTEIWLLMVSYYLIFYKNYGNGVDWRHELFCNFGGVWHVLSTRARGVQTIRRPFDYEAFRLLFRQIKNIKLHIVTDIKEKFKRWQPEEESKGLVVKKVVVLSGHPELW